MSEQTIVMDGSNPKKENAERTKVVNNINFKSELKESQQQQQSKVNTLRNIAFMVGGAGLAAVAMGFMPSNKEDFDPENPILVPDDPQQAIGVNDQMSYNEAWNTAREEVGAGGYFVWQNQPFSTYTQEEWNSLDSEDQQEFQENMKEDYAENIKIEQENNTTFVVYDQAPVAESVSDDMPFGDAFAMARQEVGPGGVFEWNGKIYSTYYKEEWNDMSAEDKNEFVASYQHIDIQQQNVQQAEVENIPEAEVVNNETAEVFMGDEMVTMENGKQVHVGYFMQDGEQVIKVDVNNDNQYDYILDRESNQLIGLNGNQDVELNQIAEPVNKVEPIMSETMEIEGYDALVTIYSDGHQEVQIDIDGDGKYDTMLSVDQYGEMKMYDNAGNLIDEHQMDIDDVSDGNPILVSNAEHDLIDEQLNNDEFGNDFDDNSDVSDWVNDDLLV